MQELYRPVLGGLNNQTVQYPGLRTPEDGRIREIRYGQCRRMSLSKDDLFEVKSRDGGTRTIFLGLKAHLQALGLETTPLDTDLIFEREWLNAWVTNQSFSWDDFAQTEVFASDGDPDEQLVFKASKEAQIWVTIPVDALAVAEGGAGGHVKVTIEQAVINREAWMPDPLGEVRDEFRVDRATAKAYQVEKGEHIQIIDVQGRQCTDFMALRADALDKGHEVAIDSTTTRTFVHTAYPTPGVFDKFYGSDMSLMLAMKQDTVGRHDTFGLACTARGYEERGFPGHINCSDNISGVWGKYGIKDRRAWPAINFFFNTSVNAGPTLGSHTIVSGEAWSRPGDFLVMEALTDMLCVSTACPDDVDPINGWNPSDVHVRIYKPTTKVSRSVAYRPFTASEAILTSNSAFHAKTSVLTRNYAPVRDTWVPQSYESTGSIAEYWACRDKVTVQDMSQLLKFDITGPDAEWLLQKAMTKDVARLSRHRGMYALMCDETGAVIDDGTLFRVDTDCFRWICGSDESGEQLRYLAKEHGLRVWVKSLGASMPNLAIQGPASRDLIRKIIFTRDSQPGLDNVKWFGSTIGRLHDRDGAPFFLSRTGYTGELGYELFCHKDDAEAIWDAIMDAGQEFGVKPMGAEAMGIMRVEAGLMASGTEFVPGVDAWEAGLGFAVDLRKADFIGKEALERNQQAPRNKLVGLVFEGNDVPLHGHHIYNPEGSGMRQIGQITTAVKSPSLEKVIAMARVAVEFADQGTKLEVGQMDGHSKRLPCTVTSIPFVDPERKRPRA